MATTCYGQEPLPELDTFAPAGDDHPGDPAEGFEAHGARHAPALSDAGAQAAEPKLAIDRMTVSIQDGLAMVFGPDGDPVPPQAVVRAAAERPEATVLLADGTTVVAGRLAMVLQAQTLGRLGAAEHGDGWIMTMLRGRDGPAMASERALGAEQESGAIDRCVERLRITTGAGAFLIADAGAGPVDAALGLFVSDGTPISVVDLARLPCARQGASGEATGTPHDASSPGEVSWDPKELDLRGCSIRTDAEGLWLESPALAAVGGRIHLAPWATPAPNGPVVEVSLTSGEVTSLPELCATLGLAGGAAADRDSPGPILDAHDRTSTSGDLSGLDPACHIATVDRTAAPRPLDASGRTTPDTAPTEPASPRLDPAASIVAGKSAIARSLLDAAELESAWMLESPVTDLPEDRPVSARRDGESGQLAAQPSSDRSAGDTQGVAVGFAGVTVPATEDEASEIARFGPATDEASRAATSLPLPAAGGQVNEIDPESIVLVTVRGVPDGARLSAGIRDDDGSWSLSPLDLPSVTIVPAEGSSAVAGSALEAELTITGIALTEEGGLAAVSETVPLADYLGELGQTMLGAGSDAVPNPSGSRSTDPQPAAIALEIDPRIWDGEQFDALVIRDLPAGAGLSAGAYDPTIDGWVLMPQDLNGLAIRPSAAQAADFTLTLMGVVLRAGDTSAARVLTRLPVMLERLSESRAAPGRGGQR